MASRYQFTEEEIAAIRAEQEKTDNERALTRLKALELRALGMTARDVALATGFHATYVTTLVARYRQEGLEALSGNHYGESRRYLSLRQEREIIEPFLERRRRGEPVSVRQVEQAYLEAVGHPVSNGQIYAVLRRYNWNGSKAPESG